MKIYKGEGQVGEAKVVLGWQALGSSLGCLSHMASIYPSMCHFLRRLYNENCRASKYSWTHLSSKQKIDLHLLISFLDSTKGGFTYEQSEI